MIRIGMDDSTKARRVEILVLAFAQMYDDLGAARCIGKRFDRELTLAVRHPPPALAVAGLAGQHLDLVRDHKGGIKADSELTDETHVFAGVARELAHKGSSTGAGDCAEVFDQLPSVHADTVIGNGKGPGGLV